MSTTAQRSWQRFVFQETHGASAHLNAEPRTVYLGLDITAPSLHPGHLVPLLMLRAIQRAGHQIIILLGGATSLIGDPTDRNSQRPLLTPEDIQKNIAQIAECIHLVLGDDVLIVNNTDWLSQVRWIQMIREIGTQVSVNKLLKTDTFAQRLTNNRPLSFLEICYPLCQAYDFTHLHKHYNCTVQCGASDQWANILAGTNLVSDTFGVTCRLLTDASGRKLSKSTHRAAWLHPSLTTTLELWQFFKNLPDGVATQLREMLDLPAAGGIKDAKSELAEHLTGVVRGKAEASAARAQAEAIFVSHDHSALPVRMVAKASYVVHKLLCAAEIAATSSQARQLVRQGAVKINDTRITDECLKIDLPCTIAVNKQRYRLQN